MIDPKALEELDLASRAIERARALLAGEGNNATAAAVSFDPWRDISTAPKDGTLILLYEDCIPASVQIGQWQEDGGCWVADPGGWSVEVAMWMPLPAPPGAHANQQSKTGVTQASDSLARPSLREIISQCHNLPHTATAARIATLAGELLAASSSPSPAVRDVTLEALKLENEDLKAFIRGIGINCQRAAETLSQVASSALHPSVAEGRSDEKI